jgi:hypothetical protein
MRSMGKRGKGRGEEEEEENKKKQYVNPSLV